MKPRQLRGPGLRVRRGPGPFQTQWRELALAQEQVIKLLAVTTRAQRASRNFRHSTSHSVPRTPQTLRTFRHCNPQAQTQTQIQTQTEFAPDTDFVLDTYFQPSDTYFQTLLIQKSLTCLRLLLAYFSYLLLLILVAPHIAAVSMSSSSSANKRTSMGRPGSGLRSQSERPSPKEGDTSTESVPTPATGAEKALPSAAKWRDPPPMVDSDSNHSYKPDGVGVEVPVQVEGKARISDKDFDAFLSAPDGRKGYMPQPVPKTQPPQQAPAASLGVPAVYVRQPLPSPGMPGSPFFSGSNISDFLEAWEYFCEDFQLSDEDRIRRISRYFGADLRDYVETLKDYVLRDWSGLKRVLLREFRDRDERQQSQTIGFLEQFAGEDQWTEENLRFYCQQFRASGSPLLKSGELNDYGVSRLFLMGMKRDLRHRTIRHAKINIEDPSSFDFGHFLNVAGQIAKTSNFDYFLKASDRARSGVDELIKRTRVPATQRVLLPQAADPIVPPVVRATAPAASDPRLDQVIRGMEKLSVHMGQLATQQQPLPQYASPPPPPPVQDWTSHQFGQQPSGPRANARQPYTQRPPGYASRGSAGNVGTTGELTGPGPGVASGPPAGSQRQPDPLKCFLCKGPHFKSQCPRIGEIDQWIDFGDRYAILWADDHTPYEHDYNSRMLPIDFIKEEGPARAARNAGGTQGRVYPETGHESGQDSRIHQSSTRGALVIDSISDQDSDSEYDTVSGNLGRYEETTYRVAPAEFDLEGYAASQDNRRSRGRPPKQQLPQQPQHGSQRGDHQGGHQGGR